MSRTEVTSQDPPRRRAGRPHGHTSPATRAELLRAAREVFAERGYEGASTSEIVQRADVNISVLYHHFGSKAGIYLAALQETYDEMLGAYERAIAGHDTFAARFDALIAAHLPFVLADPSIGPFLASANVDVRRSVELHSALDLFVRAERVFATAITGDAAKPAPRDLVGLITVLNCGLETVTSFGYSQKHYREIVDAVRRFIETSAL